MKRTGKSVQYILFVLVICSLLVLPAAGEAFPPGNVAPGESTVNDTVTPEVTAMETPQATPTEESVDPPVEEPTGTPTEEPVDAPTESLSAAPTLFSTTGTEPEVLFDGTVTLPRGAFVLTAYNSGKSYAVMNPTPLGVLHAIAESEGWVYNVTDKKYAEMRIFLLDGIESYQKGSEEWFCYVNGVPNDGIADNTSALNVVELSDGDVVTFYYGSGSNPDTATAIINATVEIDEDDWTLALIGVRNVVLPRSDYEETISSTSSHRATGPDHKSNTWEGMPLRYIIGAIDDWNYGMSSAAFNSALAAAGYDITLISIDGRETTFNSSIGIDNNNFILGYKVNGAVLDPSDAQWPLRLVGSGVNSDLSAKGVVAIRIGVEAGSTPPPPNGGTTEIRVVKYASDGVTIVNETTITYQEMMERFPIIGGDDGVRLRFQGPTFDPNDLWNPDEDKNPGKVDNVVRGTAIRYLCDLVGGVPEGGEVCLIASDGYEVKMNYTNLYEPLDRQGEPIVAWWANGKYVPEYKGGMRLFFNSPDGVFGADDMRACLAEPYWHYYDHAGVHYPSAAGCSNQKVATIEIHEAPREDWNLILTGAINVTITRSYFEQGKACAMAGHGATWIDGDDVWSGMPLWLLCGYVDDANSHDYGTECFNETLADAGYNVTVIDYGPDGIKGTDDDFSATFHSSFVKRNNNIIVADELNGAPLPKDGDKPPWPLKLVGSALTSNKQKVGSIDEIVLEGVPIIAEPPTADAVISLEPGWNFVSTPKRLADGSNTFAIFFDTVDTAGNSILIYDALEQKWDDVASTDVFRPLDGVWVYSNEACTVPLIFASGEPGLPPTKALSKGWNAIGFTDTVPESAANTLLSLGDHWTTLIGYDAKVQQYGVSIIRGADGRHGDERMMQPMQGYWIYMTEADTLAGISA